MKALRWIFAGVIFALCSTAIAGQAGRVNVSHYESLQRLDVQTTDVLRSQNDGSVVVRFDALGQTFDFQLEPNSGLLSQVSRDALPDDIGVYRGRLAGKPNSWARIVVYKGMPQGLFWDGNEMYAIEAPGDSVVNASSPVIFRLADTYIEPGTMTCGAESLSGNGAVTYSRLVGELGGALAQGPGAVSEMTIGAVGDFEFTSAKGDDAAAAAAITTRLNMVDGIFSQELGIQLNLAFIETFSDPADPFSDETEASPLLDEVVAYRQSTPAQNSLGLTHLYTGRDLNGTTVGIAYNDVLCRSDVGAGLSQGNDNATFDSLVAAHEIGHNFGAPHDGTPGACELEPLTFIMAPTLNGSTQFSQCTIDIMQVNAAQAGCISALPTVDMSVVLSGQPATVFLGNRPELTVNLNNNGGSQATNVVADIALPTNVSFVSATTSSGTCTNGAGTVNCIMGDVPGQTGRTITLTTTASAVGAGMFDVSVTSDSDERPGNNQVAQQLTVDAAVDLVINQPTAGVIDPDQSTTISAVLDNLSILDATGAVLSVSLSSGLRADSATWSIGTCTVTAQLVDCQASNFGSQSNSTIDIGVTGLEPGTHSYNVALASDLADADMSNNSASGNVRVRDPDRGSGGAAVGMPFLLLLGLMTLMRRRQTILA